MVFKMKRLNAGSIHTKQIQWFFIVLSYALCFFIAPLSYAGEPDRSDNTNQTSALGESSREEDLLPELIIRFKDGVNGSSVVQQLAQTMNISNLEHNKMRVSFINAQVVKMDSQRMQDFIDKISENKDVLSIERNQKYKAKLTVNDPRVGEQWGLTNMNAFGGWDITTGTATQYVGVIDTGIDYNHSDLSSVVWSNPRETAGDGIDNDNNGWIDDIHGLNVVTTNPSNEGDPLDDNNHGTHVTGVIAAATNNSIGIAGLNHNTKIIACKFLDNNGSGSLIGAMICMDYFLNLKRSGVNVVATNNSWGGGGAHSDLMFAAIKAHGDNNIAFIAAAGNSSNDNDQAPAYPASYRLKNVLSVAAIEEQNTLASFSNFGQRRVHIGAPGVSVLSTIRNNGYASYRGTSMASPHVAGLYSLVLSQNPSLSPEQAIARLLAGAQPTSDLLGKTVTGARASALNNVNGGALGCNGRHSYQKLINPVAAIGENVIVPVGVAVNIEYAYFTCDAGSKPSTVTAYLGDRELQLLDNGIGADVEQGDGVYSSSIQYTTEVVESWTFPNGEVLSIEVQGSDYRLVERSFNWIDIDPYRPNNLLLGDDQSTTIPLPFDVDFASSQNFRSLIVNSNGLISGSDLSNFLYINGNLPHSRLSNFTIAAYWDDLRPSAAANVYTATIGSSVGNRQFIIEWRNVPLFLDSSTLFHFQVVFFEASSDVHLNYRNVSENSPLGGGRSSTIGYQKSPRLAQTWSVNTPSIRNNTTLILKSDANDFSISLNSTGVLKVGEEVTFFGNVQNASGSVNIQLDLGDGNIVQRLQNPFTVTHRYSTPGNFIVQAEAIDLLGSREASILSVSIADLSVDEKIERARTELLNSIYAAPENFGLISSVTHQAAVAESIDRARTDLLSSIYANPEDYGLVSSVTYQAVLDQLEAIPASEITSNSIQQLSSGWHLLGSDSRMSDMSVFDSALAVWVYDASNERFNVYSSFPVVRESLLEQGYTLVNTINKNQGFWVYKR